MPTPPINMVIEHLWCRVPVYGLLMVENVGSADLWVKVTEDQNPPVTKPDGTVIHPGREELFHCPSNNAAWIVAAAGDSAAMVRYVPTVDEGAGHTNLAVLERMGIDSEGYPTFDGVRLAWLGALDWSDIRNRPASTPAQIDAAVLSAGAGPGSIAFSQAQYLGQEEASVVLVTLLRLGGSVGAASVDFQTVEGSAKAGADFVAANGTVTWSNGDMTPKTIALTLVDSAHGEFEETFQVQLSNAQGAALASPSVATIRLANISDPEPYEGDFNFSAPMYYALESADSAEVTVQRDNGASGPVGVRVTTADDSALAGVHYQAVDTVLTWDDGDRLPRSVAIPLINNADNDPQHQMPKIKVNLSEATGGASIGTEKPSTEVRIVDDEPDEVELDLFPVHPATGAIDVLFHPQKSVTLDTPTLVAAGLPLPMGMVDDVANLRVLVGGSEIPAKAVEVLRWHDYTGAPSVDSVRAALIWVELTFTSYDPVAAQVAYGTPRALEFDPGEAVPQDTWRVCNLHDDDFEYQPATYITEPWVILTCSPDHLSQCMLRTPCTPLFNNPSWFDFDSMLINFGLTSVNDVPSHVWPENLMPYETAYEPWLFDKASTLWGIYVRTGDVKWWRHAHRATQFYAGRLDVDGWFTLRGANKIMYSYGAPLLVDIMATGDTALGLKIIAVSDGAAAIQDPRVYPYSLAIFTGSDTWTERIVCYVLLAHLTAWEWSGGASYLAKISTYLDDIIDHIQNADQLGSFDGVPWPTDGGLIHSYYHHEGAGEHWPIGSPWMAAQLAETLVRLYVHSRDPRALQIITSMGDWVANYCLYDATGMHPAVEGMILPYYLASSQYHMAASWGDDIQHCFDVAAMLYRAAWAKTILGHDPGPTWTAAESLLPGAMKAFLDKYRDPVTQIEYGLPEWKLFPTVARQMNWWFGCTTDMSWLAQALEQWASGAGALGILRAEYTVEEGAGSVAITLRRTEGKAGAVSVDYATSDDTAVAGSDYTAVSGTANWADGDYAPKVINAPITIDTDPEEEKQFFFTLSNPTGGATLGEITQATVRILDDDVHPGGEMRFSESAYSVSEDGGTIQIPVQRTGASAGASSVDYATSDGTATAGVDYVAASGTLNWADGDTTDKTIEVTINDDSDAVGDRNFNLALSNPINCLFNEPSAAVVTIEEDDPSVLFSDNFDRADGDDLGANWSDPGNAFKIAGNKLALQTPYVPDSHAVALHDPISNCKFSFQFDRNTTDYLQFNFVFARAENGLTYYRVFMRPKVGLYVYRTSSLLSGGSYAGDWSGLLPGLIEVEWLPGGNIKVSVAGNVLINCTDPTPLAAGRSGFFTVNTSAPLVDDYQVLAFV